MAQMATRDLASLDVAHIVHPLWDATYGDGPVIFTEGKGAFITDSNGIEYIDGLAGLWNVTLGHGREELAEAAADQLRRLAYTSAYSGSSNPPAIELATRIVEKSYPNMQAVYFTTAGAESNESAFKIARFFHKARGNREKVKIISRKFCYHGTTMATMSATGFPAYHSMFGPLVPNFIHIEAPYRFKSPWGDLPTEEFSRKCVEALEEAIVREGPETVAALIADPVMGGAGAVPPPPDYFPQVREVCDRYGVLLIADEVITGFGRTGTWFGLEHWGVNPDLVSFAKGVTSGYLPLGGVIVSEGVFDVIKTTPPERRFMHAATYSGHPVCCAVGVKTLEILEREDLVNRAAAIGERLQRGLELLWELPSVGDVRGLGLMAGVELARDRDSRTPFPADQQVGVRVVEAAKKRGLFTRAMGDCIVLAPAFVTPEESIDRMPRILYDSILDVTGG
jgi:putrescine---pyruvate transaminase